MTGPRQNENERMHGERIKTIIRKWIPEEVEGHLLVVREGSNYRAIIEPLSWSGYFLSMMKQFFDTFFSTGQAM